MAKNEFFMYKNKPLVRCGDVLFLHVFGKCFVKVHRFAFLPAMRIVHDTEKIQPF